MELSAAEGGAVMVTLLAESVACMSLVMETSAVAGAAAMEPVVAERLVGTSSIIETLDGTCPRPACWLVREPGAAGRCVWGSWPASAPPEVRC